ncbi:MAG: GNAT family N-acetyltransferase [Candidatus Dadabacteria bacterium]|nr:MAG: GNAT family N-acetyltransferase [Candidatus Dadabacteria bacterium]
MEEISVEITSAKHSGYAEKISKLIEQASREPHTGLALRSPEYLLEKINAGQAVIALTSSKELCGFCYIESWQHGRYIANSGLVVAPEYRGIGLAAIIKRKIFKLSSRLYPTALLFGLTTSEAVMKINTQLGYRPVSFSALTSDEQFWAGCKTCSFYDVLERTGRKNCLCTAMLYKPPIEKPGVS